MEAERISINDANPAAQQVEVAKRARDQARQNFIEVVASLLPKERRLKVATAAIGYAQAEAQLARAEQNFGTAALVMQMLIADEME